MALIKQKTTHDHAVFMYERLRGGKITVNEIICRRLQTANPNVFEEMCDIVNSPYDYQQCAQILHDIGKQPLIENI